MRGDSRIEAHGEAPWFGMLPDDWPTVPLRYLVTFISGGTPDKANAGYWSGGTIPWVSPKDMKVDRIGDSADHITELALDEGVAQLVPIGSVLVVVRGMILVHSLPVAVTTQAVAINQDIKALFCGPRIRPSFLQAVLSGQSYWLLSLADSSAHGTRKLATEILQHLEVPCPSLDVQDRVVAHLREETDRIDALIAVKERLLRLLSEKRRTVIASAVTHGIRGAAKMRDSGVAWLGEIPAHWEVWKLGHLGRVGNGSTPARDKQEYWVGGTIPWMNSSVVNQVEVTSSQEFVTDVALRECHLPMLSPGVVLIAITGQGRTRGRAVVLSIAATINQHLAFVAPNRDHLDAWYLRWVLYAAYDFLRSISDDAGGTKGALTLEDVSSLRLPVPPLTEQSSIVEHIARETAKLDNFRAATERTVALLTERRAALIAAAVSGQVDVGAAA